MIGGDSVRVYLGEQVGPKRERRVQCALSSRSREYRTRLVIGDAADVRCVDQLFITVIVASLS